MSTKKAALSGEKVALYERAVATLKGVERKGASMPYTSLNGHMFSFLDQEGVLNLRLPEEARAAFLKRHKTAQPVQHGVVMKEYVVVPDGLFQDTRRLGKYLKESCDYVRTLKPKPTKRK